MGTKLERIAEISAETKKPVFTSIYHLINAELLKQCHKELDGKKAVGVDKVTKEEYGKNLDRNIEDLVQRLKNKSFKPLPSLRVYIPKGNGKMRPLGIASYEDKIVQMAVKKVLEAIYEPRFLNCMYGFRPNRGCHEAVKEVYQRISYGKISYIVDADIKGFFDHINHDWMMRFLEWHIQDPNLLWLIKKYLKAGIMELSLERTITNKKLLIQSIVIFSLVILGFLSNSFTHIGLAIIAILGAAVLIFLSKKKPEEIFAKVEWDTLFFFGGLFVLVDGIENLGIISKLSEYLIYFTNGHLKFTSSLILIISTILSPIVGSIPHTLSFGKILLEITPNFSGDTQVLWWALSLGACLGGNMTIVGAAANIVGASVAKKGGIEISFMEFLKWGTIVVAQSTILSLIYIYLRY